MILRLLISLLLLVQLVLSATSAKIQSINVNCEEDGMGVDIQFDQAFHGVIFSKNFFSSAGCNYVSNPGQDKVHFTIRAGQCGTVMGPPAVQDASAKRTRRDINGTLIGGNSTHNATSEGRQSRADMFGLDFGKIDRMLSFGMPGGNGGGASMYENSREDQPPPEALEFTGGASSNNQQPGQASPEQGAQNAGSQLNSFGSLQQPQLGQVPMGSPSLPNPNLPMPQAPMVGGMTGAAGDRIQQALTANVGTLQQQTGNSMMGNVGGLYPTQQNYNGPTRVMAFGGAPQPPSPPNPMNSYSAYQQNLQAPPGAYQQQAQYQPNYGTQNYQQPYYQQQQGQAPNYNQYQSQAGVAPGAYKVSDNNLDSAYVDDDHTTTLAPIEDAYALPADQARSDDKPMMRSDSYNSQGTASNVPGFGGDNGGGYGGGMQMPSMPNPPPYGGGDNGGGGAGYGGDNGGGFGGGMMQMPNPPAYGGGMGDGGMGGGQYGGGMPNMQPPQMPAYPSGPQMPPGPQMPDMGNSYGGGMPQMPNVGGGYGGAGGMQQMQVPEVPSMPDYAGQQNMGYGNSGGGYNANNNDNSGSYAGSGSAGQSSGSDNQNSGSQDSYGGSEIKSSKSEESNMKIATMAPKVVVTKASTRATTKADEDDTDYLASDKKVQVAGQKVVVVKNNIVPFGSRLPTVKAPAVIVKKGPVNTVVVEKKVIPLADQLPALRAVLREPSNSQSKSSQSSGSSSSQQGGGVYSDGSTSGGSYVQNGAGSSEPRQPADGYDARYESMGDKSDTMMGAQQEPKFGYNEPAGQFNNEPKFGYAEPANQYNARYENMAEPVGGGQEPQGMGYNEPAGQYGGKFDRDPKEPGFGYHEPRNQYNSRYDNMGDQSGGGQEMREPSFGGQEPKEPGFGYNEPKFGYREPQGGIMGGNGNFQDHDLSEQPGGGGAAGRSQGGFGGGGFGGGFGGGQEPREPSFGYNEPKFGYKEPQGPSQGAGYGGGVQQSGYAGGSQQNYNAGGSQGSAQQTGYGGAQQNNNNGGGYDSASQQNNAGRGSFVAGIQQNNNANQGSQGSYDAGSQQNSNAAGQSSQGSYDAGSQQSSNAGQGSYDAGSQQSNNANQGSQGSYDAGSQQSSNTGQGSQGPYDSSQQAAAASTSGSGNAALGSGLQQAGSSKGWGSSKGKGWGADKHDDSYESGSQQANHADDAKDNYDDSYGGDDSLGEAASKPLKPNQQQTSGNSQQSGGQRDVVVIVAKPAATPKPTPASKPKPVQSGSAASQSQQATNQQGGQQVSVAGSASASSGQSRQEKKDQGQNQNQNQKPQFAASKPSLGQQNSDADMQQDNNQQQGQDVAKILSGVKQHASGTSGGSSTSGSKGAITAADASDGGYIENVIIIQNDPLVQEVWDAARAIRCEWRSNYKKTVSTKERIALTEVQTMRFAGDDIEVWMEIQAGKGPWADPVSNIVPIGHTMTLLIGANDPKHEFDLRVGRCIANDGSGKSQIDLTDDNGCVVRERIMSKFDKAKNWGAESATIAFAHFSAFKFPETTKVFIECDVEVCKRGCTEMCSKSTLAAGADAGRHVSVSTGSGASASRFQDLDLSPPAKLGERHRRRRSVKSDKDTLSVKNHYEAVAPADLSFNIDIRVPSQNGTIVYAGVRQDTSNFCMSRGGFGVGVGILITAIIVASLSSVFLCLRFRNQRPLLIED